MTQEWEEVGSFKGPTGDAATLDIEPAETGAPGTEVVAINLGDIHHARLKLTVPEGQPGKQGERGEIASIRAVTLPPESPATAEVTGSPSQADIVIGVPEGKRGEPGEEGPVGPPMQFRVGQVSNSEPGGAAQFTMRVTEDGLATVVDFVAPTGRRGGEGPAGKNGTQVVYGVTTLPANTPANVINHGDEYNALWEFLLPEGQQGIQGRGFNPAGAWAPYTIYAVDDITIVLPTISVTDAGAWRRKTPGQSLGNWSLDKVNWEQWSFRGTQGPTATIALDPAGVKTLPAGYPATAVNLGDSSNMILHLEIPQGKALQTVQSPTLASALNIGTGAGQNHWAFQLSQPTPAVSVSNPNPTAPTGFLTLSMTDLLNGVTAAEAQVAPDGYNVDFTTDLRAWAGTTGSSYPRAEARELNQDGSNAGWDPATGTHIFQATYAFLEIPTDAIWPEVVIHQIHNSNNDVFAVRTTISTDINGYRNLKLNIRINGSATPANTNLQYPVVVGSKFDIRTIIDQGNLKFWFAPTAQNFGDNFTPNPQYQTTMPFQGAGIDVKAKGYNALGYGGYYDASNNWVSYTSGATFVNGLPAFYMKFGQYTQSNLIREGYTDPRYPGTAAGAKQVPVGAAPIPALPATATNTVQGGLVGKFRTRWSRVTHWHTGWPAPQRIDLGMAIPGSQGDPGTAAQIVQVSAHTVPLNADGSLGTPTVVNTGTTALALIDIGVPAGRVGPSGSMTVGQVTKLAPGSTPTFVNGGTSIAAVWNVGLVTGDNGLTAYQVAQANGYSGTQAQWLATLKGVQGDDAYTVALLAGFQGSRAVWLASLRGVQGYSAFELAQAAGYPGTQTQWIASLKGEKGDQQLFVQATNPGNKNYAYTWVQTGLGTSGNDTTTWYYTPDGA